MSTTPSAAAQFSEQLQQQQAQQSPLAQYARMQQIVGGQQEQQLNAQKIQQGQQQLADTQATTKAMQDWDGKNLEDIPALVLKNGGSSNAVFNIRNQIITQKKNLSDIAMNDATTGTKNIETFQKKMDSAAGALGGLTDAKQVPDDKLHDQAVQTVNNLVQNGLFDQAHAQQFSQLVASTNDPAELRTRIDHYAKTLQSASQVAAQAKSDAEARAANSKADIDDIKLSMMKGAKPGQFDSQIDQLVPASNPMNQQTKVLVNAALQRGDIETAQKSLDHLGNTIDEMRKTEYVQNREDYRAAKSREVSQSNQLQKNGLEQLDKIWTDPQHGYTQFIAQANATKSAIQKAKDGNELAASLEPLMTVLGVNSFAGVHRINPQEYAAAGPEVGSLYRRLNTVLDKAVAGKMNPDTLNESEEIINGLIDAKHASLLPASQLIAKNGGLDPAKTTIFGKDGKPDTLDNVAAAAAKPAPAKATGKSLTLAQVQKAAKDHGVSVEEATRQAQAAGYTVQ